MSYLDMQKFDVRAFNEALCACTGDVFIVTEEGDRLNLKSNLCQLIGFTHLIDGGRIEHARLEFAEEDDRKKMLRFALLREESGNCGRRRPLPPALGAAAVFFCRFSACLYARAIDTGAALVV